MKVSKEQAARNREKILDSAARLFREDGIDGVGIDRLMTETGLTHGCLYSQFESRQTLVAEACRHALETSAARWRQGATDSSIPNARSAIVERYLSSAHRDHPGDGCLLSALVTEIAKQPASVRKVFTTGLQQLVTILEEVSGSRRGKSQVDALSTLSLMVGAVVLARAVDDPALSGEFLQAAKARLLAEKTPLASSKLPARKKAVKKVAKKGSETPHAISPKSRRFRRDSLDPQ